MLSLTDAVEGDALLAGGRVDIASEVKGDLVVAGGELSIAVPSRRPVCRWRQRAARRDRGR